MCSTSSSSRVTPATNGLEVSTDLVPGFLQVKQNKSLNTVGLLQTPGCKCCLYFEWHVQFQDPTHIFFSMGHEPLS